MKSLQEIKEFFKGDRFAMEQGIEIESVDGDSSVCRVELRPEHRNAAGGVQGGLIFTLADFAFAVAANSEELGTVTLDSAISYMSAPKGSVLRARAKCLRRGANICNYNIDVTDDLGRQVAVVSVTGYKK